MRKQGTALGRQSGMTLIELMIVMAIGILAIIGIYTWYNKAQTNSNIQEEAKNLLGAKGIVQQRYRTRPNFTGITKEVIIKDLPESMIQAGSGSGATITSMFGGTWNLLPAKVNTTGDSFAFVVAGASASECAGLITAADANFKVILVQTTPPSGSVEANEAASIKHFAATDTNKRTVDPVAAATACKDDRVQNNLVFVDTK